MLKTATSFVDEVGSFIDAIAGLAPGQLQNEIGFGVSVLTGFGVLHVADASGFATAVYAIVASLLAAGVAVERAVTAAKTPAAKP